MSEVSKSSTRVYGGKTPALMDAAKHCSGACDRTDPPRERLSIRRDADDRTGLFGRGSVIDGELGGLGLITRMCWTNSAIFTAKATHTLSEGP